MLPALIVNQENTGLAAQGLPPAPAILVMPVQVDSTTRGVEGSTLEFVLIATAWLIVNLVSIYLAVKGFLLDSVPVVKTVLVDDTVQDVQGPHLAYAHYVQALLAAAIPM